MPYFTRLSGLSGIHTGNDLEAFVPRQGHVNLSVNLSFTGKLSDWFLAEPGLVTLRPGYTPAAITSHMRSTSSATEAAETSLQNSHFDRFVILVKKKVNLPVVTSALFLIYRFSII